MAMLGYGFRKFAGLLNANETMVWTVWVRLWQEDFFCPPTNSAIVVVSWPTQSNEKEPKWIRVPTGGLLLSCSPSFPPPRPPSIPIVHDLFKYPMPSKQFIRPLSFRPAYCQSPHINKPKTDCCSRVWVFQSIRNLVGEHFCRICIDLLLILCFPIDMSWPPDNLKESLTFHPPETSTIVIDKGTESPPDKKQDMALTDWEPSKKLYIAFFTLAVITLMAALNGTTLGVA